MKTNKTILAGALTLCFGLSAGISAQAREFGYLHAVSGLNALSVNNGDYAHTITPSTVNWSTLEHGALLGNSNWTVFASPMLGIAGVSDVISMPLPYGAFAGPIDFHVAYSALLGGGKYLISRTDETPNNAADSYGYQEPVTGAFAIGAVQNADSSIIALTNVFAVAYESSGNSRPKYIIDNPLLNNHPEAIPVMTVTKFSNDVPAGFSNNFCGSLNYDVALQRWYIASLCPAVFGSPGSRSYSWTDMDLSIKVAQPQRNGFKHTVTPANRLPGFCRDFAECSLIDNPLLNGNPDAVVVVSRGGNATSADLVGVRYNALALRWQLECIPYLGYGFDAANAPCHLNNNADYYIWVPSATAGRPTLTTDLPTITSATSAAWIPSANLLSSIDPAVQHLTVSSIGAGNSYPAILTYNGFLHGWFAEPSESSSQFAPGSRYAIHASVPRQNTFVHKTETRTGLSNYSAIDHALLNGRDSFFVAQQVLNPLATNGGTANSNQHVGLYWDGTYWTISTEDWTTGLTNNSFYNILIPERFQSAGETLAVPHPRAFRHVTDAVNTPTSSPCTAITNADWAQNPNVRLFFSHVIRDPGSSAVNFLDAEVTASFDSRFFVPSWQLCRTDGMPMPLGTKFNVIAYDNLDDRIFADGLEVR